MHTEITMLGWSIVLGLAGVLLASGMSTRQRGLRWNASNRDGPTAPVTGATARATRASANFLETFVFFATAALAVVLTHRSSAQTALGAETYFWARLAYLPIYVVGIPYLRTAVYAVSIWGLLQLVEALLQ
jgi:uncharacterized MAPEG superfamily protein